MTSVADRSLNRDGTCVHAGFVDLDGDGSADVARRVQCITGSAACPTGNAGLLVWSRAGSGPQDVLIFERYPIEGSQVTVEYKPASWYQWPDGTPTGQAPVDGQRFTMGAGSTLVRSVTVERLMGHPEQRTQTGYDYKDPYFHPVERAFAGFARVTSRPMDPSTGVNVPSSTSSMILYSQAPDGRNAESIFRVVDNLTGAPVSEVLTSHVEHELSTSSAGPGPGRSFFTVPGLVFAVEYPHDLTSAAVLDLGFDGRRPLANRADMAMPAPAIPSGAALDPTSPTGGALSLAGTAGIELPRPYPALDATQVTVEAWVSMTKAPSAKGVIARHPDGYELIIDSAGRPSFAVKVAGSWGTRVTASDALQLDQWTHLAGSYDGQDLRIFVNGVQKGILAHPGSLLYPASPGALRIGCSWSAAANAEIDCFRGSLGELRIYSEAWKSTARVTSTETAYELDILKPHFGMPVSR